MREQTEIDLTHPAEARPGKRFRRSLLGGYRRRAVDDAFTRMRLEARDLEEEAVQLREELLDARHEASETRHDLTRAKAELRYWNDRASYVDSEVARARQRATELEEQARARADAIEADAQERSLQLVDRVCNEANAMLQHAREEAREMFLRFETDVDMSQQKLDKLEQVRTEVARSMQVALEQFEEAVRELDKVGPVRRIVESLEQPVRRDVPTFGRQKAIDAARRFQDGADHGASAALTSAVPETVAGTGYEADAIDAPVGEETQAFTPISVDDPIDVVSGEDVEAAAGSDDEPQAVTPPPARRQHDADEEFASLLIQP